MNISYKWGNFSLQKAPSLGGLSDVITRIGFTYTGTDADSGYESVFHGGCSLNPPKDGDEFIKLSDLTKAKIIEWVQAAHPVDHMNNTIKIDISDQIEPKNIEVTEEELSWLGASTSE